MLNYLKFYIALAVLILSGCAREVNYRGVPEPAWRKLTAEQRQLIVDQAYEEEIQQSK